MLTNEPYCKVLPNY